MIVISGALVLVALVLLIIGLTTQGLDFVYASIAVSLVSFVFLVIGILQRRGEQPAAASGDGGSAPAGERTREGDAPEGVTAVIPAPQADSEPPLDEAAAEELLEDDEDDELAEPLAGGTVLVVAGRPRYHVDGCRYLSGKTADVVDVLDAREDGFSPCGVCRPDEALDAAEADVDVLEEEPVPARRGGKAGSAALTATAPAKKAPAGRGGARKATPPAAQSAEKPAKRAAKTASRRAVAATAELPAEEVLAEEVAAPSPAPAAAPAPAPAKKNGTRRPAKKAAPAAESAADTVEIAETVEVAPAVPVSTGRAAKAPAKRAAAKTAPANSAPTKRAAAKTAPVEAAAPAKSAAPKRGGVVVIPDRGKFHTADCRYVRGADDAETITRAQASRQGYEPCGVCRP